jgi:hypothetical protein
LEVLKTITTTNTIIYHPNIALVLTDGHAASNSRMGVHHHHPISMQRPNACRGPMAARARHVECSETGNLKQKYPIGVTREAIYV